MDSNDKRAQWRKEIRLLYARMGALIHSLEGRHPTFAGSLYQMKTRCGKPRCVCQEGKLHSAWCVSFVHQGKRCLRSIPIRFLPKLEPMTTEYKTLRTLRSDLNKVFAAIVRTLDQLERSLRIPPSRALPPRGTSRRS
jgi:hypothetical protein